MEKRTYRLAERTWALVDSEHRIIGTTTDDGDATSRQFWEGFLADPEDYDQMGLAELVDVPEDTDLVGHNLDGLSVLSLVF